MLDIARLISKPRKLGVWLFAASMAIYVLLSLYLFSQWINPSLDGRTDQHIAADSSTYIHMGEVIREGRNEPWVFAALSSFPNTLWMPVFIALVLKNTSLMAIVNFLIFAVAISLFRRSSSINGALFVILLLLNPTTTVSLLSVNKEIIDLLAVALFIYFLSTDKKWSLGCALVLSLLNRYELCVAFLIFLGLRSRLNLWRCRRWLTLMLLLAALSALLPLLASRTLAEHFVEASEGGAIAFLDSMEMHYLFILASAPKIIETFFGEIINPYKVAKYDFQDLANSYILFFNNFASVIVLLVLGWKRLLTIKLDWIYLALTIAIIMSISLVVQPRYFYACYVLLCFQAAHSQTQRRVSPNLVLVRGEATSG
jgi:hypothetical protein